MHVNEIKKEKHLLIGGQFPNRYAKMKGTAPSWFDFSQVECWINLLNNEKGTNKKTKMYTHDKRLLVIVREVILHD